LGCAKTRARCSAVEWRSKTPNALALSLAAAALFEHRLELTMRQLMQLRADEVLDETGLSHHRARVSSPPSCCRLGANVLRLRYFVCGASDSGRIATCQHIGVGIIRCGNLKTPPTLERDRPWWARKFVLRAGGLQLEPNWSA